MQVRDLIESLLQACQGDQTLPVMMSGLDKKLFHPMIKRSIGYGFDPENANTLGSPNFNYNSSECHNCQRTFIKISCEN